MEFPYSAIVERLRDGVVIVDEQARITRVNSRFCEALGYRSDELIGHSVVEFFDEADRRDFPRRWARRHWGDAADYEVVYRRRDGQRLVARVSPQAITGADGKFEGSLGIVTDITDHRNLQEEHRKSLVQAVEALAASLEKRDVYTAGHQSRVAELSVLIGRDLGLSPERLEGLYLGALVHDIGKINVPSEILTKPARLTPAEFALVKAHSQVGYDIVKTVSLAWPVATMVLQHHERLDGTGYPNGLKGDAIILESRIIAVADVAESMANPRPYRAAIALDAALEELTTRRGTAYDPDAVDACVKIIREKRLPLFQLSPAELSD